MNSINHLNINQVKRNNINKSYNGVGGGRDTY